MDMSKNKACIVVISFVYPDDETLLKVKKAMEESLVNVTEIKTEFRLIDVKAESHGNGS